MSRFNIVIIDDEAEDESNSARHQNIELLKRDEHIQVQAIHPTDVKDRLSGMKSHPPDLIIIDYRLSSIAKNGERYTYSGVSFFSLFRDALTEVPIYLISAVIDLEHGEFESDLFDRLITDKQLGDGKLVSKDATDYRKIKEKPLNQVDDAYSLISAPDISTNELERMLRPILRITDDSNSHISSADSKCLIFSRWVLKLIRNRGVLYDDLSASVLLGLSLDYFQNTFLTSKNGEELLKSALYTGVFSETHGRRWWRDSLSDYAVKMAGDMNVRQTCEILPEVLSLNDGDIAKCARCEKNYPDAIGRTAADRTQCPIHIECSEIDESQLTLPHFENDRLILELE